MLKNTFAMNLLFEETNEVEGACYIDILTSESFSSSKSSSDYF